MNREKSNSGIGLDLLANKDKTRKPNGIFFGNQNINLNKDGSEDLNLDLGDLGDLNDDDSYKFKVKTNTSELDNNINDLEKLNNYHSTFSEPKKKSPLFKVTKSLSSSSPQANSNINATAEPRHYSSHSLHNTSTHSFNQNQNQNQDNNSYEFHTPEMTPYELKRAKREVYNKLQKLKDKGIRIPRFTEDSDLAEMTEYYKMKSKDLRLYKGVRTMRKVVTSIATVTEFICGKWNPLNLELEGWSESVNENITDYDDVFEEFADKYFRDRSKLPVEIRLIGLIAWSALSFHFTNLMAKNMMRNGGKFMGMSMSDMGNMFGMNRAPQPQPDMGRPVQETMRRPSGGVSSQESVNIPRSGGQQMPLREMNGPQGVDDIINELRKDLGENDDISAEI